MKIGEKIKKLRISKQMTQEQLADKLYVSYQTISKWETGVTSPDLAQIVPIARLFRITTDELFDFNESSEQMKRNEFEKRYIDTFKTGDIKLRMRICKEVLKEYPNDIEWQNRYAWDIWCNALTIADSSLFEIEREKAIDLFKTVIERCESNDIKGNAIVGIVQCLNVKGCHEEARQYAEKYPDVKISAEEKKNLIISCMEGEEKEIVKQEQLLTRVDSLIRGLVFDYHSSVGCNIAKKIIDIVIPDGNYLDFYYYLYSIALSDAREAMNAGDLKKAIQSMRKAKEYAIAYDGIHGEYTYSSPLFHKVKHNRDNWCITGTDTMVEEFAHLFDYPQYAPLKEVPDYQTLL